MTYKRKDHSISLWLLIFLRFLIAKQLVVKMGRWLMENKVFKIIIN